jgi:hypothetical protein
MDSNRQTIFVTDAHRGNGRRFVVHADEKLSAFIELERQVLVDATIQFVCPQRSVDGKCRSRFVRLMKTKLLV